MNIIPLTITHHYPKDEIKKIGESQIHFALGLAIIDKLEEMGSIEYIYTSTDKGTDVTATLLVND